MAGLAAAALREHTGQMDPEHPVAGGQERYDFAWEAASGRAEVAGVHMDCDRRPGLEENAPYQVVEVETSSGGQEEEPCQRRCFEGRMADATGSVHLAAEAARAVPEAVAGDAAARCPDAEAAAKRAEAGHGNLECSGCPATWVRWGREL